MTRLYKIDKGFGNEEMNSKFLTVKLYKAVTANKASAFHRYVIVLDLEPPYPDNL